MVTKELSEAAVEMNVILGRAPQQFIKNIPQKFKDFLKRIESKTYLFEYDETKSLNEQSIKQETRGLIGLIYRDYICTEEERSEYITEMNLYLEQQELKKQEKYNTNDIFKNKKYTNNINEENAEEKITDIVVYKENLFRRILSKIISIFKH